MRYCVYAIKIVCLMNVERSFGVHETFEEAGETLGEDRLLRPIEQQKIGFLTNTVRTREFSSSHVPLIRELVVCGSHLRVEENTISNVTSFEGRGYKKECILYAQKAVRLDFMCVYECTWLPNHPLFLEAVASRSHSAYAVTCPLTKKSSRPWLEVTRSEGVLLNTNFFR